MPRSDADKPGRPGKTERPGKSDGPKKRSRSRKAPSSSTRGGRSRLDDARERMYRQLILESAEVVFGEHGFAGATMQDIAGRAGISLKTLYASFQSKKALVDEVQIMRGQAFAEACIAAVASGTTPLEAVSNGIHAYVAYLFEFRDWMKLHLRTRASWSLRPSSKQAISMWAAGLAPYRDAIALGIEQGVFSPVTPADPEELAALTQAIMQVSVARAADEGREDAEAVAARIVENVRMLLGAHD